MEERGPVSYRLGEAQFEDAAEEVARLERQAALAWPQEASTLVRHGLRRDADVLDAGCGPGAVSALLLELVPEGSVTALDTDPRMLAFARKRLAGAERSRVVDGSVLDTGLEDASFDVVVTRFVLQHLPDPLSAIAELRRVLRPRGRLIAVDSDELLDITIEPEPSFAAEINGAVREFQRRLGGDRRIGRRLPRLLLDAGFEDLALDVVVAHSALVSWQALRSTIPTQALATFVGAGLLRPETAAAAEAFLDRGEEPAAGLVGYFVASGRRAG